MTLVDTNVISDIVSGDRMWLQWSAQALAAQSRVGQLFTNDVAYAELSMNMPSAEELDRRLEEMTIQLAPTPRPALFLAGRVYLAYRRNEGSRTGVLPDFFIGAHAQVAEMPLLTRDVRRYRTYFPSVTLIAPSA